MTLQYLLEGCAVSGDYPKGTEITSVCCNSEDAASGSLFIALKGQKNDGRGFISEAVCRGAVCVVCEEPSVLCSVPCVTVKNVRSACARIFSNYYGNPDCGMKSIAVTGTNGKTTVAAILEHIYTSAGRKTGIVGTVSKKWGEESFGTLSDTMTTPNPEKLYEYLYRMRTAGCDTVVLEASSHALELSKLDGMHTDIGVFTNLTPEHLDFHGSMENYYRSKRRLAEKSKIFVVNYDDPYGKRLCEEFPSALAVSADPRSAVDKRVYATAAMYRSRGFSGIEYMFCCKDTVFPVRSKMTGETALYNTLISAAAALADGVPSKTIMKAVESFEGVCGRFETVCGGADVPRVIIDFAHTPDSFEKVLVQTRECMSLGTKLTVVFGCGGERDRSKRPVMGAAAEKYADRVIVTDDNPRGEDPSDIRKQIIAGIKNKNSIIEIEGREPAIRHAVSISNIRDIVLVLGKGHEEYMIDARGKHPFSEREIIKNAVFDKYGTL